MKRDGQRSRKSRVGHAPQQGSVGATRSATMNSQSGGGESMRVTVSVIKADIGAIGGHTIPSADVLAVVRDRVSRERGGLLIDGFVYHTGDDIALLMTHTRGKDHPAVHQLAWDAFRAATDVAKRQDRKSTRLNSSHANISYAVFCLKKKNRVICSRRSSRSTRNTCTSNTQT